MYIATTATKRIFELKQRIRAVQGGCLARGTKVAMADLSFRPVEEVKTGDFLMGPDGQKRSVISLFRGSAPMYKVKQKKGIMYIVNDKHILALEDQGKDMRKNVKENGKWKRKYSHRKRNDGLFYVTAGEFSEGSRRSTTRRYKGIKAKLDFPERPVEIDPYYLGLWLGDGTSRNASITNVDPEILDYLFTEIPRLYDVVVYPKDRVTTAIVKRRGLFNEIIQALKKYDLILNKHIPKEYFLNSRRIRLQLLAGLLDSDGCLAWDKKKNTTKGYYIVQKRKKLAEDIILLARTLGIYATIHERVSTMKREGGSIYSCPTYQMGLFPQNYGEIPIKVARKKSSKIRPDNVLRSSIEVVSIGDGEYYGFELDGDGLFLLEDLTITHNTGASKTVSALLILIQLAQSDTKPTITSVVSESFPHLKRGAMRDFLNIMQVHGYYADSRWDRTYNTYTFETGSKIEFFSADEAGKVRGPRRDRLFINEANNVPFETFEQLEIRTNEFVLLDWNPVSEFWFEEEVKDKRKDVEHIILTYKDNEALDVNVIASIESRRNRPGWWKVYGEGQLAEIEGKIYSGWQIIDDIPHEARLERYGLDFGYTKDPSAIVGIHYYNGGYILDEILYQTGLSNRELADTLNALPRALTVADSAEPKSIDEMRGFGVNIVPAVKGRDSVRHGIQAVQNQAISVTRRSSALLKEYRGYLWAMDRDGKFIRPNIPEKGSDHLLDAARYALSSLLPVMQRREYAASLPKFMPSREINPAV